MLYKKILHVTPPPLRCRLHGVPSAFTPLPLLVIITFFTVRDAICCEGVARLQCLFCWHAFDVTTLQFFPPAESWLVNSNFNSGVPAYTRKFDINPKGSEEHRIFKIEKYCQSHFQHRLQEELSNVSSVNIATWYNRPARSAFSLFLRASLVA